MGHKDHTTTFRAEAYEATVRRMRATGERVEDRGQQVLRETGRLDPLVDVLNGKLRASRNAFTRREDGMFVLTNGPSLPLVTGFDTTGSMGGNIELAFEAIARLYMLLEPLGGRFNAQVASALIQDVVDNFPVVQMTQFESDERSAQQLRLLLPSRYGGDSTEDYDLALLYMLQRVQTDWQDHYGLKPYLLIIADEIGRGVVEPEVVREHLGIELQSAVQTADICQLLLRSWQIFYINVGSSGYRPDQRVSRWWTSMLGHGRVLEVPNEALKFLAELQASLVWLGETARPSRDDLVQFLLAGGQNRTIGRREAELVWELLQPAEQHFGAQTRLPNYSLLPKPGDVFVDLRDPWPIGHPRFSENPSQQRPAGMDRLTAPEAPDPSGDGAGGINWSTF